MKLHAEKEYSQIIPTFWTWGDEKAPFGFELLLDFHRLRSRHHIIKRAASGSFGKERCQTCRATDVRSTLYEIHRSRRFYGKVVHVVSSSNRRFVTMNWKIQLFSNSDTIYLKRTGFLMARDSIHWPVLCLWVSGKPPVFWVSERCSRYLCGSS